MDMKKTGGQAFPTSDSQTAHAIGMAAVDGITDSAERDRLYTAVRGQAVQGMTLRDYFAAQALQGMSTGQWLDPGDYPEVARRCYAKADAMLAERAK